jgi:hypothetical protein
MSEDSDGKRMAPGFRAAMIMLAAAWLVVLVILSRTHRVGRTAEPDAVLPVYPEAYQNDMRSVPDRDWRSANYLVPLDYPSMEVFTYYDDRMKEQGWSRVDTQGMSEWQVAPRDGGRHATLTAAWFGPKRLMRLDLQLTWDSPKAGEGDSTRPQMRVFASMSRNFVPAAVTPPSREESPPSKEQTPFAQ